MFSRRNKTGIVKVRRDGVTYEIPVDQDRYVPIWAIIDRFQRVGGFRRDKSVASGRVLPNRLTPEQIIEWWIDPSSCDLQDIDTRYSPVYSVPRTILGRKRRALQNIAIISDIEETHRIKRALAESFTADELERMTRNESIYVKVVPHLRDCTGFYLRKQEGVDVPNITLERGTTPDGIAHEFVHHQRREDPYRGGVAKTPFPLDKKGYCDWQSIPTKEFESMQNLEEAATVAEATIRTRERCRSPTGYYQHTVHAEKGVKAQYDEDRDITVGDSPQKGAKAVDVLQDSFRKTNISSLKYQQGGSNADVYLV